MQVFIFLDTLSVRSERQFCERLEYELLFKWFLDVNIMDGSFDHSVFSKNRQRLLDADVAREFLLAMVDQARERHLLPEEHFSVAGTLLEAWASIKSVRPKDEEPPSGHGGQGPDRNPEWTFTESGGAMRPTVPLQTRRLGWPGREKVRRPGCALGRTC